jgi:predicted negative regulator of RcsB-dependent stress response
VARQRLTRKEIKQPDQFISYTVQTLDWAKSHAMQLLYGVLGVVAVIALIVAWSAWQTKHQQRAEILLYEAVKLLKPNETDEQKQATEQERDAAIQKLKGLLEGYPGTPAAALAHWHLGHQYYAQSEYASALTSYRQAQALLKHDEQRLVPALVALNIAYAQEASGACAEAIASFQSVLQSSWLWLHGEAFLGVGRCHETLGALEQARDVYARALSNEDVQGAVRQRLKERQTALSMQLEKAASKQNTSEVQK